jgi:hypothetical protein
MAAGFGHGAGIGRVAGVPVAGAGGIRRVGQAGLCRAVAEGGFGQRRAADIAEADEQDGGLAHPQRVSRAGQAGIAAQAALIEAAWTGWIVAWTMRLRPSCLAA